MNKYPDAPLKEQTQNYSQTQSSFSVVFSAFFSLRESKA